MTLVPAFLFNPGLVTAWFIVTGTFGVLLILNGSLVASTAMIKEREARHRRTTADDAGRHHGNHHRQDCTAYFCCSPAWSCSRSVCFICFSRADPRRILLVIGGAALSAVRHRHRYIHRDFNEVRAAGPALSFFVNPPLASLSGALTPVEAMPHWLQPVTFLNPIRHFGIITRGAMVKGSSFAELWPNFLALVLFATVLMSVSVWRFRKQLG